MKESRIYVDFNEMIENDIVLLSNTDFKEDSNGKIVELKVGMKIKIYMDDINVDGEKDDLIAEGIVDLNTFKYLYPWTTAAKWICRINENGIKHESELC